MPARDSGDRSSVLRKRALARLGREQHAAYSTLYEQVMAEHPDLTRHQARGRARTRLRHQFPARYLELLALGHDGTDVPPGIRSKSWQRATARLADLCNQDYRPRYDRFRAEGMTPARAYARAIAAVRDTQADLFEQLLAEEYRLWLAVSGETGSDREAAAGRGHAVPATGADARCDPGRAGSR